MDNLSIQDRGTKLRSPTRSSHIQNHNTDKNMDNLSIQDRSAFISIQTVMGDIVIGGWKRDFLARVYLVDDKDGRTAELNACVGGSVSEINPLCACIGPHVNPTPTMITQDVQRLNNKKHIAPEHCRH